MYMYISYIYIYSLHKDEKTGQLYILYMCTYVHIYIYVYVLIYICIHTHICVYCILIYILLHKGTGQLYTLYMCAYIHIYIHIYIYVHVYIRIHTYIYIYISCIHIYISLYKDEKTGQATHYIYTHMYTYVHVHKVLHVCICVNICACIYVYIWICVYENFFLIHTYSFKFARKFEWMKRYVNICVWEYLHATLKNAWNHSLVAEIWGGYD